MTLKIRNCSVLRLTVLVLAAIIGFTKGYAARDEYEKASEKDIVKAQTITAKFDQVAADGYNYIYWLRFNASQIKGGMPTVSIENPSLPTVDYTIVKASGSGIRKELWCKDRNGNDVRIVLKYEERPGARNATLVKLYVDTYPGKRQSQYSIDAGLVENLFYMKNEYDAGAVLLSSVNSILKPVKKWKTAKYPALFQWIDANIPGAR